MDGQRSRLTAAEARRVKRLCDLIEYVKFVRDKRLHDDEISLQIPRFFDAIVTTPEEAT